MSGARSCNAARLAVSLSLRPIFEMASNDGDLADFLQVLGGDVRNSDGSTGSIQVENSAIWIGISSGELESVVEDRQPEISGKLGAKPVSLVILELTRGDKARELAKRFAIDFMKKWSSVCSDGNGGSVSLDELAKIATPSPDLSLLSFEYSRV